MERGAENVIRPGPRTSGLRAPVCSSLVNKTAAHVLSGTAKVSRYDGGNVTVSVYDRNDIATTAITKPWFDGDVTLRITSP
jgi:hypothetical protein